MTALTHRSRFPKARRSTLDRLAKQDDTSAALAAFVKLQRRQKRIDMIKRLLNWPKRVWRW